LIDYLSFAKKKGIKVDALTQHRVTLDDVLAIAQQSNIEFRPGDILFLRVGLTQTWDNLTPEEKQAYSCNPQPRHAGLEQGEKVMRFLWDNHFSAVATDTPSFEVYPPLDQNWDMHEILLAGWGLPIGELFDLEGLAQLCEKLGRWTFFVSSSPLNCARGVSSPPSIMAIM
jgi:kynurenine formamidase